MEKIILLNGKWNGICFEPNGNKKFEFSGTVPGCVHTDLINESIIDYDIYYRDNAENCQWIENMDWEYSRSFVVGEICPNTQLVFEGLDVYCDIYLNDILLGSCDDMFISYSFDVSDKLVKGENTIKVCFHSPIAAVEGKEPLPAAFTAERLHTRRIQCTYGWDWVARLVTCGIFKDVYLKTTQGITTKNIYVYTEHIGNTSSQIAFEAQFENYEEGSTVDAEIISPEGDIIYSHKFYVCEDELNVYVDIKDAKLWYPHGYGEQPLYTLRVGNKETKFGIRNVRILEETDEIGSEYYNKCLEIKESPSAKEYDHNDEFSGFILLVNEVPIMCKGANWVPCEPFPSSETCDKITRLLELGKDCGLNMLRVWGGGIFEQEHFYNECDRLGILCTQDFLMACGKYPENDESFIENTKKETEQAALMLRNHPSLMWWSGDNENAVWGSDEKEDYNGRTVTHKSIIPVLKRIDPKRRFLLSSPYGGKFFASKTVGTTHNTQYLDYIWDYIDKTDMKDYKEVLKTYTARFIAEEPAFGAATLPSLKKFMDEKDIYDETDIWLYHTKGSPSMKKELFEYAQMFAAKVLGDFENGEDRFFKFKYLHFEWMRISFENARRNKGFCNGLIYWMFNDCWPAAISWSLLDYYALPKPAYYCFKRCAKKVVASITEEKGNYKIYLSNDTFETKDINLTLALVSEKNIDPKCCKKITIQPNCSITVDTLKVPDLENEAVIVCDITGNGVSDRAFYKKGNLPLHKTDSVKILERNENSIKVYSASYVHAVELEGEYIFEDNYFSLLPGETKEISLKKVNEKAELSVVGFTL